MSTSGGLFAQALVRPRMPLHVQGPRLTALLSLRSQEDRTMTARRFVVSGRVQGVGFRWFIVREAERLGLTGWTRNLPDGRVEVVAQGDTLALETLAAQLAEGPPAALVGRVDSSEEPPDPRRRTFDVTH